MMLRPICTMTAVTVLVTACASAPPAMPPRFAPTSASTSGRVPVAPHITCLRSAIQNSARFRELNKAAVTIAVGDTTAPAGTTGVNGSPIPTEFKREILDVLIALGFVAPSLSEMEDRAPSGYQNRSFAPLLIEVSLSGYDALTAQYSEVLNGGAAGGGGKGIWNIRGERSIEKAEGSLRAVAQLSRNFQVKLKDGLHPQFHAVASAPVEVQFRMQKVSTQLGGGVVLGIALGHDRAYTKVHGPNKAAIAAVRMAAREVLKDYFEIAPATCRGERPS